jgi:hypothetical protein
VPCGGLGPWCWAEEVAEEGRAWRDRGSVRSSRRRETRQTLRRRAGPRRGGTRTKCLGWGAMPPNRRSRARSDAWRSSKAVPAPPRPSRSLRFGRWFCFCCCWNFPRRIRRSVPQFRSNFVCNMKHFRRIMHACLGDLSGHVLPFFVSYLSCRPFLSEHWLVCIAVARCSTHFVGCSGKLLQVPSG